MKVTLELLRGEAAELNSVSIEHINECREHGLLWKLFQFFLGQYLLQKLKEENKMGLTMSTAYIEELTGLKADKGKLIMLDYYKNSKGFNILNPN